MNLKIDRRTFKPRRDVLEGTKQYQLGKSRVWLLLRGINICTVLRLYAVARG